MDKFINIKALLLYRGITFEKACREAGVVSNTVRRYITGDNGGYVAKESFKKFAAVAGIDPKILEEKEKSEG